MRGSGRVHPALTTLGGGRPPTPYTLIRGYGTQLARVPRPDRSSYPPMSPIGD